MVGVYLVLPQAGAIEGGAGGTGERFA
jgi:hypothetical protein